MLCRVRIGNGFTGSGDRLVSLVKLLLRDGVSLLLGTPRAVQQKTRYGDDDENGCGQSSGNLFDPLQSGEPRVVLFPCRADFREQRGVLGIRSVKLLAGEVEVFPRESRSRISQLCFSKLIARCLVAVPQRDSLFKTDERSFERPIVARTGRHRPLSCGEFFDRSFGHRTALFVRTILAQRRLEFLC